MSHAAPPRREPALNLPAVIVWSLAVLFVIHGVRTLLPQETDEDVLLLFAFLPVRYGGDWQLAAMLPGGTLAAIWSFLTYTLLHGSWMHLGVNAIWMTAFGSAVARRFGAVRFLLFSALAAVGGAGAHLATHFGDLSPMIGASAAISGHMAAAVRFAFRPGELPGGSSGRPDHRPALGLGGVLRQRQVIAFLVLWFGINVLFGLAGPMIPGAGDEPIAWQAHVGGFLVGLFAFPLFDPAPPRLRSPGSREHNGVLGPSEGP